MYFLKVYICLCSELLGFWTSSIAEFLENRTMGNDQKPSNSVCDTPSSELFRTYFTLLFGGSNILRLVFVLFLLHEIWAVYPVRGNPKDILVC